MDKPTLKPVHWVGSSKRDYLKFAEEVQQNMGYALYLAQTGEKAASAKSLTGLVKGTGAGVLEIVEDHTGDTCRTVYTVRFEGAIYVLHAFQKKSKKGIETPEHEKDLIRERYRAAAEHYEQQKGTRR